MLYNKPFDETDPNAPYTNGNPGTGTQGSIPPAEAIEFPQREIVAAIVAAGLTPSNSNLAQLAAAIAAIADARVAAGFPVKARGLVNGTTVTGGFNMTAAHPGTGTFNISFITPLPNALYQVLATGEDGSVVVPRISNRTTAGFTVSTVLTTGPAVDPAQLHIVVIGGP